jgi:hypothetical protein
MSMNWHRARAHGLMQPRPRQKPQRPGEAEKRWIDDAKCRRIEKWRDKWLADHAREARAIDKREQRRSEASEADRIARHNAAVRKQLRNRRKVKRPR